MNRFIALTVLLFIFSFAVRGQDLAQAKSESHIEIKGTNIFMVPPASFEPSSNFKGFQNPTDPTSMIMAMEVPGAYSDISKGFKAESLQSQGMELKTKHEIRVADMDGFIIELDHNTMGMTFSKHIIIYGNDTSSTIINGICLKDSLELGKKIKQSILTTYVDLGVKSDPREALDYTINEEVGSMKFVAVMGNAMLFNRDLMTPTESEDKATLLVDKSFAKLEIIDEKLFCISRLSKYGDNFSLLTHREIKKITLDNLDGFELFAKNEDIEEEEMYQVILFDKQGGYFIFVGTYVAGSKERLFN